MLDRPIMSMGAACKIAGTEPLSVTNWLRRGNVTFGERVSVRKLMFSEWEVLHLALLGRLRSLSTINNATLWAANAMRILRGYVDEAQAGSIMEVAAVAQGLGLFILADEHSDTQGEVAVFDMAIVFRAIIPGHHDDRVSSPAPLHSSIKADTFLFVHLGDLVARTSDAIREEDDA